MKVTRVDVSRYGKPGNSDFEILVVTVHDETGVTGIGYQLLFGSAGAIATSLIQDQLAPQIVGQNPLSTSLLWDRMYGAIPRRGGDGMVRGCIAAVDTALWDIKAKLANVPLSRLFGGHREAIATYANCAHHLDPDPLAEKAMEYVGRGHRSLKVRGTRTFVTPAVATARVQAVREAVGPDVRIMVDVNGTWDVDTAIQQLKIWEKFDVYWLEEPVPPSDLAGYARVRARSGSTYIVGGEQHAGLSEFRGLIDNDCVDIVQPNVAITGGITDWLRVHAYATAHSVPVSPWNMQGIHIHMAIGLPNVQWIEYFMPDNPLLELKSRLFTDAGIEEEVREDGVYLKAPVSPGIGLELDPAVAAECLIA